MANAVTTFAGQLQTVGGKLDAALTRRGSNLTLFVAWLAQQANEGVIERIAAFAPSFEAALTFFAKKSAVKIAYIGDNFRTWFSGYACPEPTGTLQALKIDRTMTDSEVIEKLGGREKAKTTLADIWSLLEKQPNGAAGELLTSGYANGFFVEDANGVLRTVGVSWYSSGWRVFAHAIGVSCWVGGSQVFSRNS